MKLTIPLALGLALSGLLPVTAQQLDPKQAHDILTQLKELQTQREELMKKGVASALQQIRSAAANEAAASDFYEEAVLQTQFAGQNREQTQLRDWKKEREETLKNSTFRAAARLHLNYLALTLERAAGKTNEDLLPALLQHAALMLAFNEQLETVDRQQREILDSLLRRSVVEGVFSEWLRLKEHIGKVEDWEMAAGNAEGIYNKSVLPLLREKKDPQLLQYWDARIERETASAAASDRTFDAENFTSVVLPRLRWERAQDEALLGMTARAVTEMLAIVKNHPGHPDAERWIQQLTGMVKETTAPAAAPETGTPTPALPPATGESPAP